MEALRSRSGTLQKMIEFFDEFFEAILELIERRLSFATLRSGPSEPTGGGRRAVNPSPEGSELAEFLIGYQRLNPDALKSWRDLPGGKTFELRVVVWP